MTAWIYLGLVIMSGAGMVASYLKGAEDAENKMLAHMHISQGEIERHQQAMEQAVVKAVENIRVENKTYVRNFREIEKQNTVYLECEHTDPAFRLLNSALTGGRLPVKPDLPSVVPE